MALFCCETALPLLVLLLTRRQAEGKRLCSANIQVEQHGVGVSYRILAIGLCDLLISHYSNL